MLKLNHLTGFGSGAAAAAGTPTSYVFDGTGDYLGIPDHANFDLTGDHTIECFMRVPDGTPTGDHTWYQHGDGNDDCERCQVESSTGDITFQVIETATIVNVHSSAAVLTDNTWHHVACVRDGDDYYIYVDGTDVTDTGSPDASTVSARTGDVRIGMGAVGQPFTGYIDELRISDTARYPNGTGFTPTTTQFTSDANTLLLIHGGEAYTGPLTGETTQSCINFDGTGDYLSVADHADWTLGAGDFTIEMWVYHDELAGGNDYYEQYIDDNNYIRIKQEAGGCLFQWKESSTFGADYAWSHGFTVDRWHHFAVVRETTAIKAYIDGVPAAMTEWTAISTNSVPNYAAALLIGISGAAETFDMNGKIAEYRVSDTARYTADFSSSLQTERFTSDGNTLLLIHGDEGSGTAAFTDSGDTGHTVTPTGNAFLGNGGTFTDSGNTGHTVTENGNAQRETEQEFKFADDGVGYFFDGTGDYLSVPDHADFTFGASSGFCIEMWVYMPDVSGAVGLYEQSDGSGTDAFAFYFETASRLRVRHKVSGSDTVNIQANHGMSNNTWHHIALTRNASNRFDIWVDGTSIGNDTDATAIPDFSSDVTIGIDNNTSYAGSDFNGYIDELRVSDTVRYTTGFTPSTTQHTSDANTLLLIHGGETKSGTTGSGATFTDSGNTEHTVTEVGNAIESTGNLYKF